MTTHQFSTGQIIKRGDYFYKILGEVGEVMFISFNWRKEKANIKYDDGLKTSEKVANYLTTHELNALGYVPASPEESGLSEEWGPRDWGKCWHVDKEPSETIFNKEYSWDRVLLKSGLLKRTKEEAEEAYKRLMQE